jgi:signal transduction histidine kinase
MGESPNGRATVDDIAIAQRRLQGLLDSVVAVGTDLSLPVVLRRIVEAACELADARYGALGVLSADRTGLSDFVHVGFDPATAARIGPSPSGHGVLGVLIDEPVPLRLKQISTHPRSYGFPVGHPPMNTFLGVPVPVRGEAFGNLYLTEKRTGGEFTDEDVRVVSALASAAGVAVENARLYEEAQRRQRSLEAASDLATSLLRGVDRTAALELVASTARELTGTDFGAVVLPADDPAELVVAAAVGHGAGRLRNAVLPTAGSLTGMVLLGRRIEVLTDAARDDRICLPDPSVRFGPMLLFPLSADAESQGVLVVANEPGGRAITATDLDAVGGFAAYAALALELARARDDRERLAVLEDRDRIAIDLHDLVIQRLFATGLGMQGMLRHVGPEIAERLTGYVDSLDDTIREIRQTIFSLRAPLATDDHSLATAVAAVANDVEKTLGFPPKISISGPTDRVPSPVQGHLLAVLREALSNVARHARASTVTIDLAVADVELTLLVTDDGVGIQTGGRRSGLANLAGRAVALGGWFSVSAGDYGGTKLEWRVPLPTGAG